MSLEGTTWFRDDIELPFKKELDEHREAYYALVRKADEGNAYIIAFGNSGVNQDCVVRALFEIWLPKEGIEGIDFKSLFQEALDRGAMAVTRAASNLGGKKGE